MELAWLYVCCEVGFYRLCFYCWPGSTCTVALSWLYLCCEVDWAFTVGLAIPFLCRWPGCLCSVVGLAVFAVALAWLYLCCGVGLAMLLLWHWPGYTFAVSLAWLYHCCGVGLAVFGVALVWLCLWCGVGLSRLPLLAWLRVSHGCRWLYIYPPDNIAYICLLCCIRHRTELLTEHCKCPEKLEPENKGL